LSIRRLEVAGACGLIAPFVAYACILVAVGSWAKFSWVNNALSDLGVQSGITAPLFNSGLVVSGILFIVFATGLFPLLGKSVVGKVGATVFVLACVALVCIGVFNEHFSPTHYIVSVMLFVFMPISLLILTGAFWHKGHKGLSVFTLALALVAVVPWILEFTVHYVSGVAIPELVSGLAGAAWTMVLGNKMLKEASHPVAE
jgi:hypothetical membrane protein